MRKWIYNTMIFSLVIILATSMNSCNDDYDDAALKQEISNIKERVEALESQVSQINTDISSLQKIISALDKGIFVAKIEQKEEVDIIYFTDNTVLTINKKVDANGTPIVGVKKDVDDLFYWTLTTEGITDWLQIDGKKVSVSTQAVRPIISVDEKGFWTISYDNGTTTQYLKDYKGDPISISSNDGQPSSNIFKDVTVDDHYIYFTLANETQLTVPLRADFYMLIRGTAEVTPFIYGETKVYEVESNGVDKVVVTKPDLWKVSYADNKLTVKAPSENAKDFADDKGTISIIYFDATSQSSVITMEVLVDKDYTGIAQGENFTVDLFDIQDISLKAHITPVDYEGDYVVAIYDSKKFDEIGEEAFLTEQLGMYNFYTQYGYIDNYIYKGAGTYTNGQLTANKELYLIVYGLDINRETNTCTQATPLVKIPFKSKTDIKINTEYRIEVSNITWAGATYTTNPTDDRPYMHGIISKQLFDMEESEEDFMRKYASNTAFKYREEMELGYISWEDNLTDQGPQNVIAPSEAFLQGNPLDQDTEYYVFAFACDKGTVLSPLTKVDFKTATFTPKSNATFNISTDVNRQDVSIIIESSDPTMKYKWGIFEDADYGRYNTALAFAADNMYFTLLGLQEQGRTLDEILLTGKLETTVENQKAATAYIVYAYGCSSDGTILTKPTIARFVTKGTTDTADDME